MKKVSMLVLVLVSTSLYAQGDGWKKGRDHRVGQLEKRISILQKTKSCLSGASSKEELKACQGTFKTEREALKKENVAHREAWRAKKAARKK